MESLYKFVPKDVLPEEYGGTAGKVQAFHGKFSADRNGIWTHLYYFVFQINGAKNYEITNHGSKSRKTLKLTRVRDQDSRPITTIYSG